MRRFLARVLALNKASAPEIFNVHSSRGLPAKGKQGALLLNRISPFTSTRNVVANAYGSNTRKLFNRLHIDYHGTLSPNRKWITSTSECSGDGNSDLYRTRLDGTGFEKILATSSSKMRWLSLLVAAKLSTYLPQRGP